MKISIVSMFSNEAPIASAFLDQAMEFADVLFLTAHNSYDESNNIVKSRMNSQHIVLEQSSDPKHIQSEIMTSQLQRAFRDELVDVVIPLDFDEFLPFDSRVDLEEFIDSRSADVVSWSWRNIFPQRFGSPSMFSEDFYYLHKTSRYQKVFVKRSAFLKDSNLNLFQGSHHVISNESLKTFYENEFKLLHIPIHGLHHYRQKMLLGAARVWISNLGDLGGHWTNHAELLLLNPRVDLKILAGCYPDRYCTSLHKTRKSDFGFPYVHSLYLEDEQSARMALESNSEMLASWLLNFGR